MSGQKIGSTAGRGLIAARGVPTATSHPDSNVQNGATRETSKPPELKEVDDNKNEEKDEHQPESADNSKSAGEKSASGGGPPGKDGGNGGKGHGSDPVSTEEAKKWYQGRGFIGAAIGTAVGATVAVVAAPIVIGAIGFGAGGIAAGSFAASMMSSAAIANGGAIAAGSLVATLQSIGAVGLGGAVAAGVGAAGATVGAAVGGGVGAAADLIGGNRKAAADGTDGGEENSGDVTEDMANLKLDEAQLQPTAELLSIIVSETDGSLRTFAVNRTEPLQGMFDQYYNATGLSAESVIFEFNGLRLRGSVSPAQLEIENGDIIKALQI